MDRSTNLRFLFAFASLALAPHCRHETHPTERPVDRSDGAIPELRAAHVDSGSIRIDGRLDEPAWSRAASTGLFVNPGDGHPVPDSRVNGSARVAWDDANLYVGFVVYDRDPSTPFRTTDVDPHLWERASAVELMLQPGDPGDNTNYFEIQVDTVGAVWDTQFDDYNRPIVRGADEESTRFGHQEWVSHLRSSANVDRSAGRYTLEIAVPWSSLQNARARTPPSNGDAWRVNFYTFRDGQRDSLAWSPLLGQGNFHRSARFGRVVFVR
jgi:hypothetical protein